jgi:hypothetical protein
VDAFIRQLLSLSPGYQWEARYLVHLRTRFSELEVLGSLPNTQVTGDAAQDFASVLEILAPDFRPDVLGVLQAAYAHARTYPRSGGGTTQERYRHAGQGGQGGQAGPPGTAGAAGAPPRMVGLSSPMSSTPMMEAHRLAEQAGLVSAMSVGSQDFLGSMPRTNALPPRIPMADEDQGKSKGKSGEKSVTDVDGSEWTTSDTPGFGERVDLTLGLLRVLSPELKQAFLGHSCRFRLGEIMDMINEWYLCLITNSQVDDEFNHVIALGMVKDWTVMKQQAKLENFWLFKWSWTNPVALSLAHFLPASLHFTYWSLSPSDTGRVYLNMSLVNLERLLVVLFRVPATGVSQEFRDLLADGPKVSHLPDALLFNDANRAVARVFENFRKGIPKVHRDYCGADRLAFHLQQALRKASVTIAAYTTLDIDRFKGATYKEITWLAPHTQPKADGVVKKQTKKRGSAEPEDPDSDEEKDKRPRQDKKVEPKDTAADKKGAGKGGSKETTAGDDEQTGGQQGRAKVCSRHLMKLLVAQDAQLATTLGELRPCTRQPCPFDHPGNLKSVTKSEVLATVGASMQGSKRESITNLVEKMALGVFKSA